jgi:gluconolactonase
VNRQLGRSLKRLMWVAMVMAAAATGGCERCESEFTPTACVPPVQNSGRIIEMDPALRAIVPPDYDIQKLATGFVFIEGPVWVATHPPCLLFTEVHRNEIYKYTVDGKLTVFRSPTFQGRTGPTGLTLDSEGCLVVCEHGNRRISRLERDGTRVVLAERYQGKRLNSPNDAVYKSDGWLYFTDPPYGLRKRDLDPAKELDFNGVFRFRPNGIAFSAEETVLYVSNSDPDSKALMAYDVLADGSLGAPHLFFDFTGISGEGSPDGLKTDRRGNVYVTGPGGVWIISEKGRPLGRIQLAESPSGLAWGEDGKTLYITARTSLYRIVLRAEGFIR